MRQEMMTPWTANGMAKKSKEVKQKGKCAMWMNVQATGGRFSDSKPNDIFHLFSIGTEIRFGGRISSWLWSFDWPLLPAARAGQNEQGLPKGSMVRLEAKPMDTANIYIYIQLLHIFFCIIYNYIYDIYILYIYSGFATDSWPIKVTWPQLWRAHMYCDTCLLRCLCTGGKTSSYVNNIWYLHKNQCPHQPLPASAHRLH